MLPEGEKKWECASHPHGGGGAEGLSPKGGCQREQSLMRHGLKGEYPFVTHKVSKASYATVCKQWRRNFKRPPQTSGAAADSEGTAPWEREKERVIKSRADELHL